MPYKVKKKGKVIGIYPNLLSALDSAEKNKAKVYAMKGNRLVTSWFKKINKGD